MTRSELIQLFLSPKGIGFPDGLKSFYPYGFGSKHNGSVGRKTVSILRAAGGLASCDCPQNRFYCNQRRSSKVEF